MWKTFKGPYHKVFTKEKGNLIFGIYLDWVNPYGHGIGSKSISLGVIFLVCFNLPPDIRYKPHNIFVYGFTPTPHEPASSQVDNILKPLVEELKEFYQGIFFTKTHKHPEGQVLQIALGLLMGDNPAISKLGGFPGHSGNLFCPHCSLTLKETTAI